MRGYVKYFIIASISYFVLGTFLGMLSFFNPWFLSLKTVHLHLNLLGFMSMMIFGVLYHVLPRFSGRPLYSEKLAWAHLIVGNITFILLIFMMFLNYSGLYRPILEWTKWAALAQWLTILIFAWNIFLTLFPPQKRG